MKRSYLPLILLPLLALLCGLLLWTGWQSGQSLRAARAEVQTMHAQMEQQRLSHELALSQQGQALADQKLQTLLEAYGLPASIFDEKPGATPEDHFFLYQGFPIDPTKDVQALEGIVADARQASYYTRFYHVWKAGSYEGLRACVMAEGDRMVGGLFDSDFSSPTIASPYYYEAVTDAMNFLYYPGHTDPMFQPAELSGYTYLECSNLDLGGEQGCITLVAAQNHTTHASRLAVYESMVEAGQQPRLLGVIATLDNGLWLGRPEDPRYLSVRDVTPFDLDGDGVMELITEPPMYTQPTILITGFDGQVLTRAHDIRWSVTGE